ncbi:hypothetical protein QR685DRAFT_269120 [Neurospora intermedia]|uniref:Uncharacterized protein n=1 Tax=Neurospora intermedia TaxID=5142 RepID=A0ABR3DE27_NEUIN
MVRYHKPAAEQPRHSPKTARPTQELAAQAKAVGKRHAKEVERPRVACPVLPRPGLAASPPPPLPPSTTYRHHVTFLQATKINPHTVLYSTCLTDAALCWTAIFSLIRALLSVVAVATTLKNLYRISIVLARKPKRNKPSSKSSPSIRRLMATTAATMAFVSVLVTGGD